MSPPLLRSLRGPLILAGVAARGEPLYLHELWREGLSVHRATLCVGRARRRVDRWAVLSPPLRGPHGRRGGPHERGDVSLNRDHGPVRSGGRARWRPGG